MDVCAGILKQFHGVVKGDETVSVAMRNGQVCEGRFHASVKEQAARKINWRTVDLRRAFKQLAPAPSMAPPSVVIDLWHPRHGEVRYHMLRALPFGARNAVFTFGPTARVLEHILTKLFFVVTAQHVDDFTQVQMEALVDGRDIMVEVLEMMADQEGEGRGTGVR